MTEMEEAEGGVEWRRGRRCPIKETPLTDREGRGGGGAAKVEGFAGEGRAAEGEGFAGEGGAKIPRFGFGQGYFSLYNFKYDYFTKVR